ncbi:unnamed protein product [Didymodactylos carnosus]|uniref:Uncharacterized protein n=1 Tax=Didymodactylos carnosus TaxID=1234261 RepID=A0A815EW62_9BILA|nr:unnamed protein product [Didymodactylos carnosus]CAF1381364.1 unnamed protein product [Didymodactylos carnosus]CAF4161006.1 unnamed protein product [Didymodactylos carnosus]CAF4189867.1 unnamed protein product [Didymodactylos carnosus]
MAYSFSTIDSRLNNIRDNTREGVDDIEDHAKRRAHRDPADVYEQALLDKTNNVEQTVHQQVDDVRQDVLRRRPQQGDPNYQYKAEQYQQFVRHAATGMDSMKGTFRTLFSRVGEVVRKIARWVRDNLPNIIVAIGTIFTKVVQAKESSGDGKRPLYRPAKEKSQMAKQSEQAREHGHDRQEKTPMTDGENDKRQHVETVYHENGGSSGKGGTATVKNQNQQEKGRHKRNMKDMSDKEQEKYFNDTINDFERMLINHVDELRDTIMSSRPDPEDPEYLDKKNLYVELVKGGTLMMEHLRKTITDLLTRYRLYLEELWETITSGKDPAPVTKKFEEHVDRYIQQRWDPIFDKMDQLAAEIEGKHKKEAS